MKGRGGGVRIEIRLLGMTPWLGALVLLGGPAACDRGADENAAGTAGPLYRVECRVSIQSTTEPPEVVGEARGAGDEAATLAAWADVCGQIGLAPDCADTLPEGVVRAGQACMGFSNFEGTGITLADDLTHNCRVTLRDEREVVRTEGVAEETGTRQQAEGLRDEVCAQALAAACSEVGHDGDCTSGDPPPFRITGRSSQREMVSGR